MFVGYYGGRPICVEHDHTRDAARAAQPAIAVRTYRPAGRHALSDDVQGDYDSAAKRTGSCFPADGARLLTAAARVQGGFIRGHLPEHGDATGVARHASFQRCDRRIQRRNNSAHEMTSGSLAPQDATPAARARTPGTPRRASTSTTRRRHPPSVTGIISWNRRRLMNRSARALDGLSTSTAREVLHPRQSVFTPRRPHHERSGWTRCRPPG
jgi:hypothetical protein